MKTKNISLVILSVMFFTSTTVFETCVLKKESLRRVKTPSAFSRVAQGIFSAMTYPFDLFMSLFLNTINTTPNATDSTPITPVNLQEPFSELRLESAESILSDWNRDGITLLYPDDAERIVDAFAEAANGSLDKFRQFLTSFRSLSSSFYSSPFSSDRAKRINYCRLDIYEWVEKKIDGRLPYRFSYIRYTKGEWPWASLPKLSTESAERILTDWKKWGGYNGTLLHTDDAFRIVDAFAEAADGNLGRFESYLTRFCSYAGLSQFNTGNKIEDRWSVYKSVQKIIGAKMRIYPYPYSYPY